MIKVEPLVWESESQDIQAEWTIVEYERAFKLQAYEFCQRVRRANPSLADRFDAVEKEINAATLSHGGS